MLVRLGMFTLSKLSRNSSRQPRCENCSGTLDHGGGACPSCGRPFCHPCVCKHGTRVPGRGVIVACVCGENVRFDC
jgi:hypothetical protein